MLSTVISSFACRTPARRVRLLLRLARTEAGGAIDIAHAARTIGSEDVRRHLLRHAADEERHAVLLRSRALELFEEAQGPLEAPFSDGPDLAPATPAGPGRDVTLFDHGLVPSDRYASLGEVAYIAMLHLAEQRAAREFECLRRASEARDPRTAAMFATILRDEAYHVAWTGAHLDRLSVRGSRAEVETELRRMRRLHVRGRLLAVAGSVADVLGRSFLTALGVLVFWPFGIAGRLVARPAGWVARS